MKLTEYYIRIAKLISLEATGELAESEKTELEKWLSSSSENKQLYDKLKDELPNLIQENASLKIQKDITWNTIQNRTKKSRQRGIYLEFLKYAAILLIVFSVSGILYWNISNKFENNHVVDYSVNSKLEPGESRALLVTSDGENIELNKEQKDSIQEQNGSLIKTEGNVLTYDKSANKTAAGQKQGKTIFNTLITPKGGEWHLVLSDGTKVWINADSKLIYPVEFHGDTRELTLEGEAYFEVTKNLRKPFIITTNNYNIEVLGTSFNVSAYRNDDRAITTLISGSVKIKDFDDSGNEVKMNPDEQLILNTIEKGILIKKVDVQDYVAWKDGRFIFVKENLEDILEILSRWYNFEIQFESEELKTMIFTGNMDKYDQLAMPLEMIAETNKVNFKIENKTVLVTKRK